MSATLDTVAAILKDDYKDYWDQLNNANWFLAQVEQKSDTVEGGVAVHGLHVGRSGGIGARAEGVDLPTAGNQAHKTVRVPVRWQYGRIQLSLQLIKQATGGSASFVNAMSSEMDGIREEALRDVSRQLWGTSNGVIATCGTTTTSATIQLATTTTASQLRHLYVGRVVDIGTVATPDTIAADRTITAVDEANKTITISGATVSTTSSHFIFNANSGGATDNTGDPNDGQSELTGLQTIVDDAITLHTLTVAAAPVWKAQVYSNGAVNRQLSESMVNLAIQQCAIRSGYTPNMLVSNIGVFASAGAILSTYNRNSDVLNLKGGYRAIKWSTPGVSGMQGGEVGWMTDYDCPENRLFGLNMDKFVWHQVVTGWEWMDEDGAILHRVDNKAAYEATLYTSAELATGQRNAHFVIEDLSELSL